MLDVTHVPLELMAIACAYLMRYCLLINGNLCFCDLSLLRSNLGRAICWLGSLTVLRSAPIYVLSLSASFSRRQTASFRLC